MLNTLKRIFINNPMLDESLRFRRKYLRAEGDLYKVIVFFVIAFYIMVLYLIARGASELVLPICYVELTVITILLPLTVYGAISEEREKGTWVALILTRLSSAQIVAGKLLWRLGILVGLMLLHYIAAWVSILNSDPFGYNYTYHELDPIEIARIHSRELSQLNYMQLPIFTFGCLITSFGLFVSSRTNRSITSIGVIIGVMLFMLAFIPAIMSTIFGGGDNAGLLYFHPFGLINEIYSDRTYHGTDSGENINTQIINIVCFAYLWLTAGCIYLSYSNLVRMSVPFIRSKKHAKTK